jgi:hypothetical protein
MPSVAFRPGGAEAYCRLLFSTGVEAKVAQNETVVRQGVTAEKAAAKQRQTQHE